MEIVDVVNERDEIIGQEPRLKADYQKNFYRIVHVFVLNDKGQMALQLRSPKLSYMPGAWCTAACGHVSSGESYEIAAKRETKEETGLDISLKFLAKDVFTITHKGILASYKGIWNGDFEPQTVDVEKIQFFTLPQIQDMIDKGEKFHPETLFLLQKHFGIK